MASEIETGVARRQSRHSVDATVERLTGLLAAKGVTLFTPVDHSGEAAKAGMTMPNTKLLIFGSPKAGTPVMLAAPGIALDLPLKILVREDGEGSVWLEWNQPQYLADRHGVPADLVKNISAAEGLAVAAAS